jgi:hypothetical protein
MDLIDLHPKEKSPIPRLGHTATVYPDSLEDRMMIPRDCVDNFCLHRPHNHPLFMIGLKLLRLTSELSES